MYLVIEHFLGQAGVGAEEDGGVHDGVGAGECGCDAGVGDFREGCAVGTNQADGFGAVFAHLNEDGLPEEISAKKHTVAYLFFIQVVRQRTMIKGSRRLDANHEAKPRAVGAATCGVPLISRSAFALRDYGVTRRRVASGGWVPCCGMGGQAEFEDIFEISETSAKDFPVAFTGLDEGGKFFELLTAYGGLGVERLEVVAEVAVDVFVIVALRQLTELPAKAFAAGIVLARGTPAVASPITEALGVGF